MISSIPSSSMEDSLTARRARFLGVFDALVEVLLVQRFCGDGDGANIELSALVDGVRRRGTAAVLGAITNCCFGMSRKLGVRTIQIFLDLIW